MSVKKIHLFPSEESYVANSGSVDADDVALVPLNLAPVAKTGSFNSLSDKPKAYITETWVSGTSGYRIWSDGFIEQWGKIHLSGESSYHTLTFKKAFKNTNYNVQTASWGTTDRHACMKNKTTTSVQLAAWNNDNDWYAFGY